MEKAIIEWFERWIDKLSQTCVDDPEEFLMDLVDSIDFMEEAVRYLKEKN